MYPGKYAAEHPDRPAFIMAQSGEAVTYREYEARCNRLAHLFRDQGLAPCDHYAIFMENNARYPESVGAGERSGLYFTCVNSFLTADEVAYIVNNSESRLLITSQARREVALAALEQCPDVKLCLIVDGPGESDQIVNLEEALAGFPVTPITDERFGQTMLYSSGTTGRPKGILRPMPDEAPEYNLPVQEFLQKLWHYREDMIYLSPAPLYHAAPNGGVSFTLRFGGTAVIMEEFDPEFYLALIGKHQVSHTQLVPTMFSRMLKLPAEVRESYDVSSLEIALHAAAPCPVPVKEEMIDWWGPIVEEYYGATEGLGFTACNSEEWLAHRGSVGRVMLGDLHILDDEMNPSAPGTTGTVWFASATEFEYFRDPERTAEAKSADGAMSTVGDMGYIDEDNFLYLTDRAAFMIISGGVNIYPQECENLLITHPKVADAAVFGVPNDDLGEEVKAVVQALPDVPPGDDLAVELIAFCRDNLAHLKCPKTVDFTEQLPRLPTGKLYKRLLRDQYWDDRQSRIV